MLSIPIATTKKRKPNIVYTMPCIASIHSEYTKNKQRNYELLLTTYELLATCVAAGFDKTGVTMVQGFQLYSQISRGTICIVGICVGNATTAGNNSYSVL